MSKYVTYFVDDNIRFLENIAKTKPASIFDDPYLGFHKKLHDELGLKVQLNVFYENFDRTFNLSMVPDTYKEEFMANKDWLSFGFHARHELPDYPYLNATYQEVWDEYSMIENEVIRFAGKETLTKSAITHWVTMSKEGLMALKDKGIEMISCTMGDEVTYPEIRSGFSTEHNYTLLKNTTRNVSRAMVARLGNGGAALVNHNNMSSELTSQYLGKIKLYQDKETGLYYNRFYTILLNATRMCDLDAILERLKDQEHVCIASHEQYFYSDYFAYEPDYADKVAYTLKYLLDKDFTHITLTDLIDLQK